MHIFTFLTTLTKNVIKQPRTSNKAPIADMFWEKYAFCVNIGSHISSCYVASV